MNNWHIKVNSINQCMFILDQEEMYFKISQTQNQNNNNGNNEEESESAPDNNEENAKNSPQNQIGTNFQGNLEKTIIKLKSQNEYENLFFNSSKPKKVITINNNVNDDRSSQYEQGPSKIPETTSNELMNSFEYYDRIKKDIFNEEEIQNMHKEIYSTHSSKNSRIHITKPKKINIQNQNQSNNHKIDKFSLKANMNFNSIYKINSDKGKKNPIKINLNKNSNNNNNKDEDKNIKIINNKEEQNNENNNVKDTGEKKEVEDKNKIVNNNNNDMNNDNDNDNDNDNNNQEDNINNDDINNNTGNDKENENDNNGDDNKDNSEMDNNLETISLNNEENEEKEVGKCINYKNTSILALVKKKNLSLLNNKPNNIDLGSALFRGMNTFNLNLLLNALKSNNKYSISNYTNSIIL